MNAESSSVLDYNGLKEQYAKSKHDLTRDQLQASLCKIYADETKDHKVEIDSKKKDFKDFIVKEGQTDSVHGYGSKDITPEDIRSERMKIALQKQMKALKALDLHRDEKMQTINETR